MFQRKRSPEEEKSKLVKQKKSPGSTVRGRQLPRGNRSLPLGLGHTDLLPLCLLTWFRLGLHSALSAGMSVGGGRSLVQRGSIDNFLVWDNWGRYGRRSISKRCGRRSISKRCGRKSISKRCWADKHLAIFIRIILTPVLSEMPG
jgi:hypothetical protein